MDYIAAVPLKMVVSFDVLYGLEEKKRYYFLGGDNRRTDLSIAQLCGFFAPSSTPVASWCWKTCRDISYASACVQVLLMVILNEAEGVFASTIQE